MTPPEERIWGRHPVLEALRAGTVTSVTIATGRRSSPVIDEIRSAAERAHVPVHEANVQTLARMAPGENTQGVFATVRQRSPISLDDLLRGRTRQAFLLVLDEIQDPHNLGALLRSAEAAGVDGVVLPERRSAPLSGTVSKSSAGAVSHLAIAQVPNVAKALEALRDANIWTIGLNGEASQLIYDADFTVSTALVVGSEGRGLRRLVREKCDLLVRLPMAGHVTSLNASVAGGVALYEVVRQRLRGSGLQ